MIRMLGCAVPVTLYVKGLSSATMHGVPDVGCWSIFHRPSQSDCFFFQPGGSPSIITFYSPVGWFLLLFQHPLTIFVFNEQTVPLYGSRAARGATVPIAISVFDEQLFGFSLLTFLFPLFIPHP